MTPVTLAIKAEELSDAEQRQLLSIDTQELAFGANHRSEGFLVGQQACAIDTELHANFPLGRFDFLRPYRIYAWPVLECVFSCFLRISTHDSHQ